jgi:hypothetical protein
VTATNLNARPIPHPPWVNGVIENVDDPNTVPKGTLEDGENMVPELAPRLATRGGSRIVNTLHDDQGSPAELAHVLGGLGKAATGALVIGWSSATTKHYAYALDSAMAFASGTEATSRTAFPTSWNRATPARPVLATLFEKHYVCDAQTDFSIRNPFEMIDGAVPPVFTEPTFEFVTGGAGAAVLKPYTLEEYNNVLFIAGYGDEEAGGSDAPALLRHSFLGVAPEAAGGFDKDAYNTIGAKGARIYALKKGRGLLLIAKENELYRLTGFGKAYPGWQYQVEGVNNTQGYGVENALALEHAEGWWFGIGKEGPFRTDGFSVDPMRGPRQATWKGIDKLDKCWVRYHPERRVVLFGVHFVAGAPDTTWPWMILVWDCARNVWQPNWRVVGSSIRFTAAATVATTTVAAPSGPPTAPNTTLLTDVSWRANWTTGDASAQTEYWEKRVTGGGSYALIAVVAAGTNLYNENGRTNHNDYTWKVRHVKGGVYSAFSSEVAVKTLIAVPDVDAVATGLYPLAPHVQVTVTSRTDTMTIKVERAPSPFSVWTEIYSNGGFSGTGTVYDSPGAGSWRYRAKSVDSAWSPTDSAYTTTTTVVVS